MKRVRTEHEGGVDTTVFFDNDGNSLRVIMDDEGLSLKALNGYGERMIGTRAMTAAEWWSFIEDGGVLARPGEEVESHIERYLRENGYATIYEWMLDSDYARDDSVSSGWVDEGGNEVDPHEQINAALEGLEHDMKSSLLWPEDRFYIPCKQCGKNLDQVLANERALCVECEQKLSGFFVAVRVYTTEDGQVSRVLHGPFRNIEEGEAFLNEGPDEKDLSEALVWYVNPKEQR